jgi:hypothetical protein
LIEDRDVKATAALILLASTAARAERCLMLLLQQVQLATADRAKSPRQSFRKIWFAPGVAPKVGLTRNFPNDSV